MTSPITISANETDGQVIQLGLACGLLRPVAGEQGVYEIDPDWFSDPVGKTGAGLGNNPETLAVLIAGLIGDMSGSSLGIPVKEPGDLGTWYPINKPGTDEPSGLYLATQPTKAEPTGEGEPPTVFGIGVMYTQKVALSDAEKVDLDLTSGGPDGIDIKVWGLIPIVLLGDGSVSVVAGSEKHPFTIGFEVVGSDSSPLISVAGFQFDGVRFSVNISPLADPPVSVSLVVLGLKLPTDAAPSDRTLADLEAISGAEILATAAALALAALGKLVGDQPSLPYLLPALGLGPKVPGVANVSLPILRWDQFVENAISGGDVAQPFLNWFTALSSDLKNLSAWLQAVGGAIGGISGTAPDVTGTGSREDPYKVPVFEVKGVGKLELSAATTTDAKGVRHFYPGLAFDSDPAVLGSTDVALVGSAAMEFLDFALSSGAAPIQPGQFHAGLTLGNKTEGQPLFSGSIGGSAYTFGALNLGLVVAITSTGVSVLPACALMSVSTPTGKYPSIDLTQPDQLVDAAEAELTAALNTVFNELFGLGSDSKIGVSLAALIGVSAPDGRSDDWPLTPPFGVKGIVDSIQHPVDALGAYWGDLIRTTTPVTGQPPFYYMVQALGHVLQEAGVGAVTGSGTKAAPWSVPLTKTAGSAALQAYIAPIAPAGNSTAQRLVLGIGAQTSMPIAGNTLDLGFALDVLGLDAGAAAGDGLTGAQILPGVSFVGRLPDGVSTPAVAGAVLKVDSGSFSVGWSPYSTWSWSMDVAAPVLVVDGVSQPIGSAMNYSDSDSLESLVTQQAQTFASILMAVLGVALYRTQDRGGLALTGWLGLLPKLASFMPDGVVWPAAMPTLTPTSFDNPIGQLRDQIKAVLSTDDQAKAALGLLGWAIDGQSAKAAPITGAGSQNAPYILPLGLPGGVEGSLWQDAGKTFVAPGLTTRQTATIGKVRADTSVRLDPVALAWANGLPLNSAGLPALGIRTLLRGVSGPLVTVGGVDVQDVTLGLELGLDLSKGTPAFTVTPVIEATRSGGDTLSLLAASDVAAQNDLQAWVNAGIDAAGKACAGNDSFDQIYRVLAGLGLAVPAAKTNPSYGIDAAGWRALTSDPVGFMSGALMTALANPATQSDLFAAICTTLDFEVSAAVPQPLLALLSGLGILQDQAHGFAPNPMAIIAVLRDPAGQLAARVSALVTTPAARSAVIATMGNGSGTFTLGPLEISTANGRSIAITLPRGSLSLGDFADPSLSYSIDLESGVMTLALDLFIPDAGFSLVTGLSYTVGGAAPTVTTSLVWGDGKVPQPAALTLYPFDATKFVDQLAAVAPAYVLSIFVAEVVQDRLLDQYQLAQSLFALFGLAEEAPAGSNKWVMKSTLGLFEDPLGWLLSDAVVGANGKLNIAALNKVLTTLPAGTAAGLTLAQTTDGALLTGLPYGLQLQATASTATGLFALTPGLSAPISVAGGDVSLDTLGFGLTLTSDFQPGLTGAGRLVAQIPGLSGGLFLQGGFDKGFDLTLGQVGDGKPTLDLIPFGSWETFALSVASEVAQKLLSTLTDALLTGLKDKGDVKLAAFVDKMRSTATSLQIDALVSALIAAQPDPAKLETAAFGWLTDRLTPTNAAATASAVADLISLALDGVTSDGGLLSYAPSDKVPVTIIAGLKGETGNQQIGIWATLATKVADDHVVIALAPTGVGIPVQGDATPIVTFGLTTQAIVALDEGPGLSISFDSAGGGHVSALIDPMMTRGKPGKMKVELLPNLFGVTDKTGYDKALEAALELWLLDVLKYVLPRYVSIVVLNTKAVEGWLDAPLTDKVPLEPGKVLVDTQMLVMSGKTYILNDLDALLALGPEKFLGGFVKALTQTQIQILAIGEGGGIWLEPDPNDSAAFGIRFAVTDLSLKAAPNFVFQIGAEDTNWIALTGADPKDFESGIAAYVPLDDLVPDFGKLKLRLINVGVDFQGKTGQPLIDLTRFQLGKIKPRGLISFDFAKPSVVDSYGGGIDFEDIAISLAPNAMVPGDKGNAVAENLLGSGDDDTQSNPPTNPGFSARAGYISGHDLGVELYDSSGTGQTRIWIPVQRSFGPVTANKIGFGWDNPKRLASVLFDGSLNLAGLTVDLIELSVSVNVTKITDYSQYELDLGGLAVSFNGGAVSIDGGLLKNDDPLRYDGQLLVKIGSFTIYAVGSFAMIPNDPNDPSKGNAISFFVFLNVNAPLGGVPAFFVKGIAGGFSVNRNIIVPDAGDIMGFPLIQGAISQATFGDNPTPKSALATLSDTVYPEIGTYWAAAGLKFSSFELVDVFAMLLVKFGREFEIDVIGVASASLPPEIPPPKALAFIELAVVASFKITEGVISVTAQLTPNSFLLVKDCKLTGGFAAKFWFGTNPNAGDFVITLGGYHPAFKPPPYYPNVPRLGFDWPVLDTSSVKLSIGGGTYFALTPSMVMAGGYLKALFSAGPLKAWFDAGADFLISWQPFYYTIEVHITVGASLGVTIGGVDITLTAELGAQLQIWGPPTAGIVHVSWFVISFDIPFGVQDDKDASKAALPWHIFQERMLPQPPKKDEVVAMAVAQGTAPAAKPGYDQVVLKVQITNGLLSDHTGNGAVVQAMPFTLELRSVMPGSTVTAAQSTYSAASPPLGIQPMGQPDVTTAIAATLKTQNDAKDWVIVSLDRPGVVTQGLTGGAPDAVWSTKQFEPGGEPTATMISGAQFGLSISTTGDHLVDILEGMDLIKAFGHESAAALPLPFDITPSFLPVPPALPQDQRFATLMRTVMDASTADAPAARRAAIMQAVTDSDVAAIVDQNLSVLAKFADDLFQAPPHLAELGFDQAATAAPVVDLEATPMAQVSAAMGDPERAEIAPRFLGGTQSFALPGKVAAAGERSIYLATPKIVARWKDVDHTGHNVTERAHHAQDGLQTGLRRGTLAVLDLGSGAGQPMIQVDGAVPVQVYAFDASGRILSDGIVAPDDDTGDVALPQDAAHVACLGLGACDHGAPAGWNLRSTLFQVAHHTMLGDGCTIRPQSSPRLRHSRREQRRGTISGHGLMTSNRVQHGVGETASGWAETIFGSPVRTVAVVLKHGADPYGVRVKCAATTSPWHVSYDGASEPVDVLETYDGVALIFDLTDLPAGTPDRHAVLVSGTEDLAGVYGWKGDRAAVLQGWEGHVLTSLARPLPGIEAMRAANGRTTLRVYRG
ncbi:YdbH domain-containing protein [Roseovarius sp. M141]|uniref:YdbH domain-containing protein n=1 Tax=Roseovarius sp. M141 TaxID=2583806 RepID=UPI0020CF9EDF|nr:YdbH domain-containing protein [Roseovarius sp. M141]MCQ0090815.1 hypothetical protein [Roseovarius sp. M141]